MELITVTDKNEIKRYIDLLYTELFGQDSVPTEDMFDKIFTQLKDPSNKHTAYCLKEGDETIAFFTLGESFSIFAHGKYGIINELWVSDKFRSQGVGKIAIQEIKKIATQRGWQRIDVTAPPSERWARSFEFYRKNGFILTGKKLKLFL